MVPYPITEGLPQANWSGINHKQTAKLIRPTSTDWTAAGPVYVVKKVNHLC